MADSFICLFERQISKLTCNNSHNELCVFHILLMDFMEDTREIRTDRILYFTIILTIYFNLFAFNVITECHDRLLTMKINPK